MIITPGATPTVTLGPFKATNGTTTLTSGVPVITLSIGGAAYQAAQGQLGLIDITGRVAYTYAAVETIPAGVEIELQADISTPVTSLTFFRRDQIGPVPTTSAGGGSGGVTF